MENKNSSNSHKSRILLIIIILIVITAAVVFAIKAISDKKNGVDGYLETNESIYGDASLGIDSDVDKELRDYRNILIFGIDNKHRSDIVMLASINKKTGEVKLISVHRDTYLQLRDEGDTYYIGGKDREFFKGNHAYKKGGFYAAMKEYNSNLDLNCHEGIGLDWDAIEALIDGVGGLDADVTPAMIKWANQRTNHHAVIPRTGYQHLDGAQAVGYLRTRYDATAVQRAERNEDAFVQVFEKANELGNKEKLELLDKLYEMADTNMSQNTMTDILNKLASFKLNPMGDWPHDWELYWDKDMSFYYFVPFTLSSNVSKLHKEMFGQEDYKPSAVVERISERIEERIPDLYEDERKGFGRE